MNISRNELLRGLDGLLQPERFKDYGPNGLQVEGKDSIQRIVSGVTASRALIEAAIAARADALFVHHGLFWRGQDGRIVGWMKERLRLLLAHDISLFAYHLPLDAHPELGNNAQLGRVLGWQADQRFGEQELGCVAPAAFADAQALAAHVERVLGRAATLVPGDSTRPIRRVAWCTGGGRGFLKPPSRPGPTPSSPAKSPSHKPTWRVRPVSLSSLPGTTPPSAMALPPWLRTWRRSTVWSTSSSTLRIRPERVLLHIS